MQLLQSVFYLCACRSDLLEKGRTTGQAARLLYEPSRREKLEREAAVAEQAQEQNKARKKGAGGAGKAESKPDDMAKATAEPAQSQGVQEDEEQEEEEEEPDELHLVALPIRHSYSLVCYGLPNLVVATQSGKN